MIDDLLTRFRSDVPPAGEATARRIYARTTGSRRRLPRRRLVLATAVAVGVGTPAAVFGAGLVDRTPSPTWVGLHLQRQFVSDVVQAATLDPEPRFAHADRTTILRALVRNARRFDYQVKRVQVLPGRDGAPLIIVRFTGSALANFSRSIPTLERLLDPPSSIPQIGIDHLKYEAFFLEAVDAQDVPFVVIYNVWRQPHAGGGQWARAQVLYPFVHG